MQRFDEISILRNLSGLNIGTKIEGGGEICLVSFHLNQDGNYVSLINIDNR